MKRIVIILSIISFALFAREVKFDYSPNISAQTVALAGTFNNWSSDATPMSDLDGDGKWEITLDLRDGEYQYKFVVNGGTWITDPNNPKGAPDGYGGSNSIIIVGDWEKFIGPSERGDGEILDGALWHEQKLPYLCDDGGEKLWIRLRTKKGDIDCASLVFHSGRMLPDTIAMTYLCAEAPFEWFEIAVPFYFDVRYSFLVGDGHSISSYPQDSFFRAEPGNAPVFITPQWPRGALFYQIFPERFANGNPGNDPDNVMPWGSKPEYHNFMGGDIQGVIDRLPYLDSLGIDAIYFNPIFEASSNHKYDTHDYYTIDDNFGNDLLFEKLDSAMEACDVKIVLDGVFNHIGFGSAIFQDVVENGAESDYADWFFIHDYPVSGPENPNYDCWWGFGSLPKLNTENPAVREYLFGAIRKWTQLGADGWRLDVANEVPHEFWRAFRDSIRAVDDDAYSIGEIWGDGTPWLGGDEFDAVMNYRFRDACIEFFAKSNITPEDFLDRLGGYMADYAQPVNAVMLNLLGSHDTPRFLTIANGENWRLRLALFWTLIWPGAPCIYYGDEIGMTGGKDPGCRKTFPWEFSDSWDEKALNLVRYIAALRDKNRCLREGTFRPLFIDNSAKVLVIERRFGDELAVVAVNLSGDEYPVSVNMLSSNEWAPEDKIPFPEKNLGCATEAFSGERYYDPDPLKFTIPARDAMLFIIK